MFTDAAARRGRGAVEQRGDRGGNGESWTAEVVAGSNTQGERKKVHSKVSGTRGGKRGIHEGNPKERQSGQGRTCWTRGDDILKGEEVGI